MSLSEARIAEVVREVMACVGQGRAGARDMACPLIRHQSSQVRAAAALVHLVAQGAFAPADGLELLREVFDAHVNEADLVSRVGGALEAVRGRQQFNAAPPTDGLFESVANRLLRMSEEMNWQGEGGDDAGVLRSLSTVSGLLGRAWDGVTEHCHLRLIEMGPERWQDHFALGSFYKTRGRFGEGVIANQCAAALGGQAEDAVIWNAGICATGALDGETALHMWRRLDLEAEIGRFGLPESRLPPVKVCLVEHPMAERAGGPDDPGREETTWIERLSPCHGIIRSALLEDIGVDYGDVVLFDGAAIAHHREGNVEVPVFPHLATLFRSGYRIYRFAGVQREDRQIAGLSARLPGDGIWYEHAERVVMSCAACWERGAMAHEHVRCEHRVVMGKLCVPPLVEPGPLLVLLDELVAGAEGVRIFVPALSLAAGDAARSVWESRWVNELGGMEPNS